MLLIEVQISGTGTTRESIVLNEALLKIALKHLGMRPSVQTCMLHIKSTYSLMQIDVAGFSVAGCLQNRCYEHVFAGLAN